MGCCEPRAWTDPEGNLVNSFSIVTCGPNDLMKDIHNRMPVILKPENEALWLDRGSQQLLLSYGKLLLARFCL
ncbi:SOS response-associated peptidase family protein [Paenibacillus sp. UNC451MF]|uniref:SOS response-associated peptidase family protein n=1 Tax=Paenibacillus sp. UNC451MF TaxID=1449063 RepID=UPI0009DE9162|nr:SOS response-associated peptidase family protein [Paenibacillus sp. UNC451MF]